MEEARKVAVITGGGRNVGEAIAKRLASDGFAVAIVDMDMTRGGRVASEINDMNPGSAAEFVCEVSDSQSVRAMVSQVTDRWGRIDALVNCAAITDRGEDILTITEDTWDHVIAVNLKGPFLCTKYVAQAMVERQVAGNIISIASTSGYFGNTFRIAYPTAKAALFNFTRSVAAQLAPYHIRVNTITPNQVGSPVGQDVERPEGAITNLIGRNCEPGDIAGIASFLLGPDASFLTGIDILADGGVLSAPRLG